MQKQTVIKSVIFFALAAYSVHAQDEAPLSDTEVLGWAMSVIKGKEDPPKIAIPPRDLPPDKYVPALNTYMALKADRDQPVDADTPLAETKRLAELGNANALTVLRDRLLAVPVSEQKDDAFLEALVRACGHPGAKKILLNKIPVDENTPIGKLKELAGQGHEKAPKELERRKNAPVEGTTSEADLKKYAEAGNEQAKDMLFQREPVSDSGTKIKEMADRGHKASIAKRDALLKETVDNGTKPELLQTLVEIGDPRAQKEIDRRKAEADRIRKEEEERWNKISREGNKVIDIAAAGKTCYFTKKDGTLWKVEENQGTPTPLAAHVKEIVKATEGRCYFHKTDGSLWETGAKAQRIPFITDEHGFALYKGDLIKKEGGRNGKVASGIKQYTAINDDGVFCLDKGGQFEYRTLRNNKPYSIDSGVVNIKIGERTATGVNGAIIPGGRDIYWIKKNGSLWYNTAWGIQLPRNAKLTSNMEMRNGRSGVAPDTLLLVQYDGRVNVKYADVLFKKGDTLYESSSADGAGNGRSNRFENVQSVSAGPGYYVFVQKNGTAEIAKTEFPIAQDTTQVARDVTKAAAGANCVWLIRQDETLWKAAAKENNPQPQQIAVEPTQPKDLQKKMEIVAEEPILVEPMQTAQTQNEQNRIEAVPQTDTPSTGRIQRRQQGQSQYPGGVPGMIEDAGKIIRLIDRFRR